MPPPPNESLERSAAPVSCVLNRTDGNACLVRRRVAPSVLSVVSAIMNNEYCFEREGDTYICVGLVDTINRETSECVYGDSTKTALTVLDYYR